MEATMKALPLLLLLSLPAFADDWPQKGDTVYVAADTTSTLRAAFTIEQMKDSESAVPACWPCVVTRITAGDKASWSISPRKHFSAVLVGSAWPMKFHRSEAQCRAAFVKDGQPLLLRTGPVHTLK